MEDAADQLGGLDVVVINAGKQTSQESIFDITTEQFDQTYKTNVYAMFWLSKAAIPHLPKGGSLINVTSIQGYKPSANLLDYASTKWAIIGFTKALAKQMVERGIRVNAVAPGPIWTPLNPCGGASEEKLEHFGESTPMGRPGQPNEVAPAFLFLACQDASYMSGQVLHPNGGMIVNG